MSGAARRVVPFAFVFPLAFALAFLGLFARNADAHAFSSSSVLALALCGAVAASALAGFGVARPAAFAAAVSSWLAADIALHFALRDAALQLATSAVTPAEGERAFATSVAIALASRDVGALASASMALGLVVSFLCRARRDGFLEVIAFAALAVVLTALALPAHGGSHHLRHALTIFADDATQGRAALVDALAHAAEAQRGFDTIALVAAVVAVVAIVALAVRPNRRAVVDALACVALIALAVAVDLTLASAPIARLCETIAPPMDAAASTRDNAP